VQATAELKGGKAVLQPTGQELPLEGAPPDAPAARRKFRVLDWTDRAKTRLAPLE
jgi:hypothetical protein